jgi:cyclopropane fatty-acyl-phospholipid synthase-like methyltransferase
MNNLDLYAKAEHLLGIQEATEALHELYLHVLQDYSVNTLLDVGCGRGGFMQMMQESGVTCKGIDLSPVMVDACKKEGLDVECIDIQEEHGSYDAIVAIFDVLNFLDKTALSEFLEAVAEKLNEGGIFVADINTLHGFSNVAEGTMSAEDEHSFLCVDALFEQNKLHTTFTLFEKESQGLYTKLQDTIVQYFHKIDTFSRLASLKLLEKQNISLYDRNDKTLLVLQKKVKQ